MNYASPLRYPGGKGVLADYVKLLFKENDLLDGIYVEPYVGGGGVALSLLFGEYVSKIVINDLNKSIYSFWYSVLNHSDELCELISSTEVTVDEWYKQKEIQKNNEASVLDIGFSTFFLNRTNRSGIISGGIIGGINQEGKWKIDARFNKTELINRIQRLTRYKNRIELYNLDALVLLTTVVPELPQKTLIYLDPPYYNKGQDLYQNHYAHGDHEKLAEKMKNLRNDYWFITYDSVEPITEMYNQFRQTNFSLNYSANNKYTGLEVMIYSNKLGVPEVENPLKVDVS